MQLHYRLGVGELLDFGQFSRRQQAKGAVVIASGILCMIVCAVLLACLADQQFGASCVLFPAAVLIVLAAIATLRIWVIGRLPEVELKVDEDGIRVASGEHEIDLPWSRCVGWYPTKYLFVLEYTANRQRLAIPKRCCDETRWDELLNLAPRPHRVPQIERPPLSEAFFRTRDEYK